MKRGECWGGPLDGMVAPPTLLRNYPAAFPAPGGWYYRRGRNYYFESAWYDEEDNEFWLTYAPMDLVSRFIWR